MQAAAAGAASSHSPGAFARKARRSLSSPAGPPSSSRPRAPISCSISRSLRPRASTNWPSASRRPPKPYHDQPRLRHARHDQRPGGEEQVDAFGDNQLPHVAHDTVTARIELAECLPCTSFASPGDDFAGCRAVGEPCSICSFNRPSASRYLPNPTTTSHASATRATTSGQAARSRSTPLETIRRSSRYGHGEDRVRGVPSLHQLRLPRRRFPPDASLSASPVKPIAASASRRGRKELTFTPGGPSRVRSGSEGSLENTSHRLSAV